MTDESGAIEYPIDLPIKLMGHDTERFRAVVLEIVGRHFGEVDPASLKSRPSRNGRYVAYTVTVRADSREQLEAAYADFSAAEEVLWAI